MQILRDYLGKYDAPAGTDAIGRIAHQQGIPIKATAQSILTEMEAAPPGSGGLIFGDGHVIGIQKLTDGRINLWDAQSGYNTYEPMRTPEGKPTPGQFSNIVSPNSNILNSFAHAADAYFYRYK
jgi:hypothetical protein